MPIICSICDKVIRADIEQGKKDKPICKDCALVELPKARGYVKEHNVNVNKGDTNHGTKRGKSS